MSALDAQVAAILDSAPSDDEDALIASLEESEAVDAFREQRIQQLHAEFTRAQAQKKQGFGIYTEIKEEKALMDLTTEIKYAVVHFAKDDFTRCRVMDDHLEALAKIHTDTRFLKINVENAPFLVTKLKVQVLPCVISFIDGQSVDRLVGFEGVSYQPDTLKTKDLEARFLSAGVVQRSKATQDARFQSGSRSATKDDEDDDDDEWD